MGNAGDADIALTATAAAGPTDPHPVAATLGRYRLDGVLGTGGMGRVHAAFDLDLERRVAIKVLHADPAHGSRLRLMREARAMARLDHPNVVKIYEVDSIDNVDFVVMELVDGGSIEQWLATPHSARDIMEVYVAAGRGLAAAHAVGMVHRDFKPHNVMRSSAGAIKVGDFGLARDAGDAPAQPEPHLAESIPSTLGTLTQTGAMVGTPAYMAPEQWAVGTISAAADQFAFCVALWEALSGKRPFEGATTGELRAAIEKGPSSLDARVLPRTYRAAILRGLEVDPAKRWPSMDALLDRLAAPPKRPKLPRVAGIALALGLAVVLATTIFGHDVAPPPIPPVTPLHIVPKSHDALLASVSSLDPVTFAVPRSTVDQILSERTELTEAAHFVAVRDEDGEVSGFRALAIRKGSVAAKLGIHGNDIFTEINDVELTSDESVNAIYELARKQTSLELRGTRVGKPFAITIQITN